jgi:hypothetical protein
MGISKGVTRLSFRPRTRAGAREPGFVPAGLSAPLTSVRSWHKCEVSAGPCELPLMDAKRTCPVSPEATRMTLAVL